MSLTNTWAKVRRDPLTAGKRKVDQVVELPDGRTLRTLADAIAWLAMETPKSEHGMKPVQAAAHCITEAAENNGPMIFARIGMMQAINRHHVKEFDTSRKPHHWGNENSGGTNDRPDLCQYLKTGRRSRPT
jgi:hypothetical protein